MAEAVHKIAEDKGWWEPDKAPSFPEQMMLVVTEVAEAVEEFRQGQVPEGIYFVDGKPEGIPSELADVIIRILDTCEAYGIDIDSAIALKMKYNEGRTYRHGGKRL